MPAATDIDTQKVCFQRGLAAGSIAAKGLSDVTLITGATEALGHGLYIDEKSIEGLMSLLMGKSLPGYLTHEGAMFGDRLGGEIGIFSGFYRDGLKIKAKVFNFLNAFVKHEAQTHEKLVELAEKMPEQFGLSVVFSGEAVWVKSDGEEVDGDEPMPEGALRGLRSVRFKSIESADFVKAPAANPDGLFAAQVDGASKGMATETIALSAHNEALAAKTAELTALSAQLATLKTEHAAALVEKETAHVAALAAKDEEHKTALAAINGSLAAVTAERDEALKYDMRKAGAPALEAALQSVDGVTLPTPAATDKGKWDQFAELEKTDPKAAEAFKAKFIKTGPLKHGALCR